MTNQNEIECHDCNLKGLSVPATNDYLCWEHWASYRDAEIHQAWRSGFIAGGK